MEESKKIKNPEILKTRALMHAQPPFPFPPVTPAWPISVAIKYYPLYPLKLILILCIFNIPSTLEVYKMAQ